MATVAAQDAESALKQFEGKILILRHPLHGDSLSYDADGKILKGGHEESWTTHGGILIGHITVAPDKLHFEGTRILFMLSLRNMAIREFKKLEDSPARPPLSPKVNVTIKLDRAIDSAEQANTIVGRIFALNDADFLSSLPDLWRSYMEKNFLYDPPRQTEGVAFWKKEEAQNSTPAQDAGPEATLSNDGLIYHVGKEVAPPKAMHTPAPEFSEIARYEKYEGVLVMTIIVGIDGKVHNPRVALPRGLGLDEKAASMIQTWRFEPGTLNGKPVAVEMNVEVAFHLF